MILAEDGCAIRLLGRAAAESGRLGHGDGGHGRDDRRRRALMLTILKPEGTRLVACHLY